MTHFVQAQQSTNAEFRIALNDVRSQITKLTSYMGNFQQVKGKLLSQTIQNPQGKNSVGISSPNDVTFEHCKAVTTLRSEKKFDKTIKPKEFSKETTKDFQNEPPRDDDVFDKPHVPRTDIVDVDPEKEKATCVPLAPYPHKLRAPKKLNNHSEIYELFKHVKVNIPLLNALK